MIDQSARKRKPRILTKVQHQVNDIFFLPFEIAAANNLDKDYEWALGTESRKISVLIEERGCVKKCYIQYSRCFLHRISRKPRSIITRLWDLELSKYLDVKEPHICLYRDRVEIVLTKTSSEKVHTNRKLYGYGEDAYFITDNQEALQNEFISKGAKIVRPLHITDYNNMEFVLEDIDGRWIAFGMKQK